MNQETIPDNNLPVYFQKYKVEILDGKDNKTKTGSITYTTVGALPSNLKNERVWAFNLTGILKPNVDKYYIVYDFSEVESSFKVKFKDFVSGTISICGQVLDATKLIKDRYTYSLEDSIVIIELDTSIWDFQLKKESIFSYNLMINDDATSCPDEITTLGSEDIKTNNFEYTYSENKSQLKVYNRDRNHNNYFFNTDKDVEFIPVATRRSSPECNNLAPKTYICDLKGENCFLQRLFSLEFPDLCRKTAETLSTYFTWSYKEKNEEENEEEIYQLEISDITTNWTLVDLQINFQNYTDCTPLSKFYISNTSSYTIKIQKLSIQYSSTNTYKNDTSMTLSKGDKIKITVS